MSKSRRIRTAIAATGTGLVMLSGCSEATSGTAGPEVENLLDARLQLEQSIRYSASILGCMVLDKEAGTYRDDRGDLTNINNSDGPDHAPHTDDDGPQHVRLSASGGSVDDMPYLRLEADNLQDHPSRGIVVMAWMDPATGQAWQRDGMTAEVLQRNLKNLESPEISFDNGTEYDTYIALSGEQAALITIPHSRPDGVEYQKDVPANLALANRYSRVINGLTNQLLTDSSITGCNLG
jgi:hypothetical protein